MRNSRKTKKLLTLMNRKDKEKNSKIRRWLEQEISLEMISRRLKFPTIKDQQTMKILILTFMAESVSTQ
jgi:hypothetical protein